MLSSVICTTILFVVVTADPTCNGIVNAQLVKCPQSVSCEHFCGASRTNASACVEGCTLVGKCQCLQGYVWRDANRTACLLPDECRRLLKPQRSARSIEVIDAQLVLVCPEEKPEDADSILFEDAGTKLDTGHHSFEPLSRDDKALKRQVKQLLNKTQPYIEGGNVTLKALAEGVCYGCGTLPCQMVARQMQAEHTQKRPLTSGESPTRVRREPIRGLLRRGAQQLYQLGGCRTIACFVYHRPVHEPHLIEEHGGDQHHAWYGNGSKSGRGRIHRRCIDYLSDVEVTSSGILQNENEETLSENETLA